MWIKKTQPERIDSLWLYNSYIETKRNLLMSNNSKYAASLFAQFLSQELRKDPKVIPNCIGKAIIRFSPVATPKQQRDYVDSIFSTIADREGNLIPNWQDEIMTHHG
jgi:hypothetical protein